MLGVGPTGAVDAVGYGARGGFNPFIPVLRLFPGEIDGGSKV